MIGFSKHTIRTYSLLAKRTLATCRYLLVLDMLLLTVLFGVAEAAVC